MARFFPYVILCVSALYSCSAEKKASLAPQAPKKKEIAAEHPVTTVQNTKPNESSESKEDHLQVVPKKEIEFRINGEVSAIRNSQIAFRAVGFIDNVRVKPGAFVKKGQILATLDDRDFALRFALAQARQEQAKISMESAEKEFKREQQLRNEKASTASVYDKIKAGFDQSSLSLKLAQLDVAVADLSLKDTRLLAPYDCVVVRQMKYEGENVPAGTAVFEVYDTAEPEITLTAPERLMSSFAIGGQLSVSIPSAAYTGKAEIIRIVPVVSQKTRTFQITAKLLEYNSKIVPGSYAEASLLPH